MKNFKNSFARKNCPIFVWGCFFVVSFFSANLGAESSRPKVSNPSKFKVSYSLEKKNQSQQKLGAPGLFSGGSVASVAVNILDPRFYPVKTFVLKDVKNKNRVESLWDGRDVYGKEMPAGDYYASLSVLYSDGTKETKFFKFTKE